MKAFYGMLIGCIIGLVVITIHYSHVLNDYKKRIEAVEKRGPLIIEKLQPGKSDHASTKAVKELTGILNKLYLCTDQGKIDKLEQEGKETMERLEKGDE